MITDAVLGWVVGAFTALLALLPNPLPPALADAASSLTPVWTFFAWANKYVPLAEAAAMLGLLAAVQVAMFAWNFSVWALTKLHVLGGQ